jgi:hypothetical protein
MEKVKAVFIYIGVITVTLLVSHIVKAADIYIPEGQNHIVVEGTIEVDDHLILEALVEELDYENQELIPVVVLESGGGNLMAGIRMATVVRLSGLSTYVDTYCASSCSVIFAAGYYSLLGEKGKIGLHNPYTPEFNEDGETIGILSESEEKGFSWWAMYGSFITSFQDEDMAKTWIDKTFNTPSEEMFWIDAESSEEYGITVL